MILESTLAIYLFRESSYFHLLGSQIFLQGDPTFEIFHQDEVLHFQSSELEFLFYLVRQWIVNVLTKLLFKLYFSILLQHKEGKIKLITTNKFKSLALLLWLLVQSRGLLTLIPIFLIGWCIRGVMNNASSSFCVVLIYRVSMQ